MCMACQEMELYYAYLDALEEEKRKAQPWECEVTVIPQVDASAQPAAEPPAAEPPGAGRPAAARSTRPPRGFVCDNPE
jgi:hypothetical protein